MATLNEEKLVSAFLEKVSMRSSFNLQICSANDLINFWKQTFQNGHLVAILNFYNFVIFM